MNTSFSDILSLAKKTGDAVIVTDSEGQEPVVILPFERYRKYINGKALENTTIETMVTPVAQAKIVAESVVVLPKENPEKSPELPPIAEEQFYLEPVE